MEQSTYYPSMVFPYLSEDRRRHIDDVVEKLRREYSTSSGIDFDRLSRDCGFHCVITGDTSTPITIPHKGRNFAFVPNSYLFSRSTSYAQAHEVGHILLGHLESGRPWNPFGNPFEENEANYFAHKITGTSYLFSRFIWHIDDIITGIRHPILRLKESLLNESGHLKSKM